MKIELFPHSIMRHITRHVTWVVEKWLKILPDEVKRKYAVQQPRPTKIFETMLFLNKLKLTTGLVCFVRSLLS